MRDDDRPWIPWAQPTDDELWERADDYRDQLKENA